MQSDGCFFVLSNIDSECTISILQIGPQAVAGRSSISWYSGASKSCPTRRILCCGWNKRNPKTARIRVYDEQKLGRSSLQQGATDTRLENKIADSTWSSSGVGLSLFAVTRFTLMFFYNVAQIIYRDFKSSNVLLDENFHPKLSDFGLAREGPEFGRTHVSTAVMGTNGYAAPDYIKTGHLTAKSDVWSYGVVLYEILTGRRSLERHHPRPEQNLVEWVKYINPDSEKFSSIIDPRLENEYPINTARKVAKLANTCLEKNAKDRPSMAEVVNRLKQIIKAKDDDEPYEKSPDNSDNKPDMEREPEKTKVMDSWRRRMSHLQKLGEHVEGASRRRFMIMQRAKVP